MIVPSITMTLLYIRVGLVGNFSLSLWWLFSSEHLMDIIFTRNPSSSHTCTLTLYGLGHFPTATAVDQLRGAGGRGPRAHHHGGCHEALGDAASTAYTVPLQHDLAARPKDGDLVATIDIWGCCVCIRFGCEREQECGHPRASLVRLPPRLATSRPRSIGAPSVTSLMFC
jgi:hypothetical protein